MSHRLAAVALLATTTAACTVHLPAPAAPPRRTPGVAMPAERPVPGMGRVVFDTPGRPTRVSRIAAVGHGYAGTEVSGFVSTQHVCTTPCVVDLPRGEHHLTFVEVDGDGIGAAYVAVGDRPRVVAGALGKHERLGGWAFLGGTLVVGGSISAAVGALMGTDSDAGSQALAGGVGAIVVGLLMIVADQSEEQRATFDQYDLE